MGKKYLIDTNIAIYFLDAQLTPAGMIYLVKALNAGDCYISVISKMELLGWTFKSPTDEQKAKDFVDELNVISLTDTIADKTIEIRKSRPKTKLPDAIIAATALVNDMVLITRNTPDFIGVRDLETVNPFEF